MEKSGPGSVREEITSGTAEAATASHGREQKGRQRSSGRKITCHRTAPLLGAGGKVASAKGSDGRAAKGA